MITSFQSSKYFIKRQLLKNDITKIIPNKTINESIPRSIIKKLKNKILPQVLSHRFKLKFLLDKNFILRFY